MARGQGSRLWDETGKEYLDFIQGWAVNTFGHCPPLVASALAAQAQQLVTPSPAFYTRPQLDLARRLVELTGARQVAYVNSGAEANEAAIKLARKWGRLNRNGASTIVTTLGAFHGRTLATMAASGKPGWDQLFPPNPPGFIKVPYGDTAAVAAAIDAATVAVMVEPIQGEAGVVVPPAEYLGELRALCDAHDLLLIADEVQTGVGRTGRFLAQEHAGIDADITTLGKGLGAGVPVAAVLAGERASCFEPGDQGSTFGGNPLMTAVALAVVNVVSQPSFLAQVRARGERLRAALVQLATAMPGSRVRGQGLLWALVLDQPWAPAITDAARELGLLVNPARPNILRFMPQLALSSEDIETMSERLRGAFARVLT